MTPEERRRRAEELRRRADALRAWEAAHGAAETPCPVCAGVRWFWRLEHAGPFVPRACACCGYVQWFDAKLLGVEPLPAPAEQSHAAKAGQPGKDG